MANSKGTVNKLFQMMKLKCSISNNSFHLCPTDITPSVARIKINS